MWINMSKAEVQKLKRAIALVGFTSTAADKPLVRLRDKLDEALADAKNPVLQKYRERADEEKGREGELEIDDDAVVSHGEDRGAYVMAWVWIEDEEDEEENRSDA